MRKSIFTLSIFTGILVSGVFAQPSVQKLKLRLQQTAVPVADFTINQQMPEQASILFDNKASLPISSISDWLSTNFQFRSNTDALVQKGTPASFKGIEVQKLQQYYKGIPVEHGIINATAKNGKVAMMQMEFYTLEDGFSITPSLSENAARTAAIKSVGAQQYAWQDTVSKTPLPAGQLVIIADFFNHAKMELAYKFDIYATVPFSRAWVYVNATNGSILLTDSRAYHANADGKADTRYSGRQDIVTDLQAGPLANPYRLQQTRNGHLIKTLNLGKKDITPANLAAATDFTDNDNDWTTAEHGGASQDDAALEAHFNMQLVSDYFKEKHGRNGWDNNNSTITGYIHVTENGTFYDNAKWSVDAMYFGDGNGAGDPPQVSIDDCGHELGHAICQSSPGLVYRWESGALNEGFSDIWAACITNYAITKYPGITGSKRLWRLFEESSNPAAIKPGLRDMSDPTIFGDPSTYKGKNWLPASFDVCPRPGKNPPNKNDYCGVHTNSGVLNKWFYLITNGEAGNNSFNTPYNVSGLGFFKSEDIAYLTELNLTPNASFKTARNVSVNVAIAFYGTDPSVAQTVQDAWLAVGVDTAVFNMSNTAAFTTNSFSTIAVGKDGAIWAGTTTGANSASNGVYRYDGKDWKQAPVLLNNAIQGMTVDNDGGIWMAQSGRTGAQATTGGVAYFPDSAFGSYKSYGTGDGLVSRNSRSIYVDRTRTTTLGNPVVWVASLAQITAGASANGGISTGLNTYVPVVSNYFSKISEGIELKNDVGGSQTIGGNGTEVWAFASNNFGRSQIIVYDAATQDSINFWDYTNNVFLTSSFQAKAIYFDVNGNKWLGMQQNGLVVLDKGGLWHRIDTVAFKDILPYGTIINNNAVTGDKMGNVYFGTTNGLVYYNRGPITQASSYRRLTTANGLPSNNVRAVAVDTIHYKLLVATDNGIVFFDQQCAGKDDCFEQIPVTKSASTTLSSGNWSDPSIWNNNTIPDEYTDVLLLFPVLVDIDAKCATLNVTSPGGVTVAAGKKLVIAEATDNADQTSGKKKQ